METRAQLPKLAILGGGGDLPGRLAEACVATQRPFLLLAMTEIATVNFGTIPHRSIQVGKVGHLLKLLRAEGCEEVVMVGYVTRPNLTKLKIDFSGALLLPRLLRAMRRGDGPALETLVRYLEEKGFRVVGAESVLGDLKVGEGVLGTHRPSASNENDIWRAVNVIRALGPFDVGQGAIVRRNMVLAIEAMEGTDAMLDRCAGLPKATDADPGKKHGVLVKIPKPEQERRVDLPTIGVRTLDKVAAAGLAGIAVATGGALIIDRAQVVSRADELGLFVVGIDTNDG